MQRCNKECFEEATRVLTSGVSSTAEGGKRAVTNEPGLLPPPPIHLG